MRVWASGVTFAIWGYAAPDPDEVVRKNVATLIREVAKHSAELAQLIVNSGGGWAARHIRRVL